MNIRIFLYAVMIRLLVCNSVLAQTTDRSDNFQYQSELDEFQQAIENNFYDPAAGFYKETVVVEKDKNAFSYLWPLCGLIQANNEIEKLSGKKDLVQRMLNMIQEYYDPVAPAPGYASYIMKLKGGDRFYDDNQWIGIACLDAYKREKNPAFLKQAELIYRYMMTGYDTVLQGGIYWQENKKTSKNTCSNGPGIVLALQLYQATKQKSYLDTALQLYKWVNDHLKAPSGLYYDNIQVGNKKIGKAIYSYNTGTMLQSNIYLYEITRDRKYLKQAVAIADSALLYFHANGTFRDDYWFNAVLLRAYQHLLQHHKDTKYIKAFQVCTDHALMKNRNPLGLMGKDKTLDLVAQSGMLEILARLAFLQKTHQL
ncbi:glycoside hydrolase family 76 protein [Chitinophagaceae bacterium LB-8]|uniref:Glycoside hydrolase family 76 protein n=1 Tax=Paraflavisolibacter caeni TaxID=2982496 RepID=A0A9X2XP07_9BACT|nr:glycoside hydrolase family 76 protein [Paraflavisolibacter caeni]MCU7549599.1 glycoside hydrolase family 76 protein [Paraflavisolibacter caeni]